MKKFYQQSIILQWVAAIIIAALGFIPILGVIVIAEHQPIYYLLALICIPISQFTLTPLLTLSKVYTYYSPMLLGYNATDKIIDLHSGTGFDYFLEMRQYKAGAELRNRLLMYYVEGLMKIISSIENHQIPVTVDIEGTSYFLTERTLHKLGFQLTKPSLSYRINLFVNIIDLTWMHSLSRAKFSVPHVWKAKKAVITGDKLLESKSKIQLIYNLLKDREIR
jgi:hypothetical protein